MSPLLEVSGLAVLRDGGAIVREVSFAVARGERVAIMGASGAGKTTVLRAIAGLEPLSAGTIVLDGARLAAAGEGAASRDVQRHVGMVFQFHHLFAHMTALQNVSLAPVHVYRRPRNEAAADALALLHKLGVGHRAGAMPDELSGGEAQRVAIARALAVNPPLLLMDEPTASLDAGRRGELAATVRALAAEGTTLIVATHDAEFARGCAERVIVLEAGRVVRDAAAGAVLR